MPRARPRNPYFAECDCCGKLKHRDSISCVWADWIGEAYACAACRGWPEDDCTCRMPVVHSTDIDPPEPILDRYCPIHGDGGPDPDEAYDARRDRQFED